MSQSPYHLGFTTLNSETSTVQLPVRGTVPAWLTGTLVRNGPARFEIGDQKYNHWFDGLAMLHRFAFAAGRVSYANRYLRSQAYEEGTAKGRISRGEFATDPCRSLFHHVNAFEDGDDMVVDIVAHPDPAIIDQLYLHRLRSSEPVTATGKLTRFRISAGDKAPGERLSEASIELPRFDYRRRAGRRYRYVYGAGNEVPGDFIDNLVKLDVERGTASTWREEGCYPGEPVFVAGPQAPNEDDGVILSVVLDTRKAASFLLILDASTFSELARADAPHPIPYGIHGTFLAQVSRSAS
jgi:carotenoid cleavage dioxygenase-like enzyme